ncbi:MAG: DUF1844 domain-containing protein [candidate division Zixibacteria bacterium]|nr:DUF1844 domain-containing protein [candidate division Zixibacteria bacterium]
MTDNQTELDVMFYQLVLSMQASTMQYLGKVISPVSGKIERNMDAAKYSVDILDMLKKKTAGNLSDDEAKMLDSVLYQLHMNYVEEVNKGEGDTDAEKSNESTAEETDEGKEASDDAGKPEPPSEES